jgi:hypothetical protein
MERGDKGSVHCSLKLVVSNGPSGLETPNPSGFSGLKVLGLKQLGFSDSGCGWSAGLETPIALRGDGVASPSGFEMLKTFGSEVSRAGANGLRVCGVEGPGFEKPTVLRLRCLRFCGPEMSKVFGSAVSTVCGIDEANARG